MCTASLSALAVPLQTVPTFCGANPLECRRGSISLLTARGIGTNEFYTLEVDPATGAIPTATTVVFPYDTNYGTVGSTTLRTAAQLGNATGGADFGAGNTSAQTLRAVIATNQSALPVTQSGTWSVGASNFPTTVDTNFGTPGSSTLRTAAMLGVGSSAVSSGNPVPISDAGGSVTVDGSVSATNFPTTVDVNFGAVGSSTPRGAAMLGVGTTAVSNANPVPIADAGGSITVDGTVAISNLPATADTNHGAAGASTIRTAAQLGVAGAAVTNANPVPISDAGGSLTVDGTVSTSNWPATVDTNHGSASSSTPRTAAQLGVAGAAVSSSNPVPTSTVGKTYSDSVRLDYGTTNVTTSAWVQIIASTAAAITQLLVDDTCGEVLELGTGGSGSETRRLLIPRGGLSQAVNLTIASGTRLSVRALTATCSTGDLVITGFN